MNPRLLFSACFVLLLVFTHVRGQELRPDEMILEFERLDGAELRQAAALLQQIPGVKVVALSPLHQVVLLRVDEQQVTKGDVLSRLADSRFFCREKYGTIAQVLDNLGSDFISVDQFQPRSR
ncbi:MAG: hypothetical protein RMK52_03025 [Chitinophagales bacterium]|nr:hypothetical protein [Chitinophagales bacterium]